MKNYYLKINSKIVKDNVFGLLQMDIEKSPELALKYLSIEYGFSKYFDAALHRKSASLKRGSFILTLMQGSDVSYYIHENERRLTFVLKNKFDKTKVNYIILSYNNVSDIPGIMGVIRTNSDFKPLKTY